MAYFPAFIKLDNLNILIVGGGKIATEKLEHLLDFTSNIEIIAQHINNDMQKLIDGNNLKSNIKKYQKSDIDSFGIIIVAVDDIPLQKEIFDEAKLLPNTLVNSVDSTDYCDFIFPSYIKKDDLTIAVSTSGSSPAMAKYLRKFLENLIPNSIGEFLKQMKGYRKTMPKGKREWSFWIIKPKNMLII